MHIENFRTFSDLVASGSFSRAAQLNGITQSAMSQQLQSMEKHFNVQIIDRNQKKFALTIEGKKVHRAALDMLRRYDELMADLQDLGDTVTGTIHVATIYSIGLHELPPYIKKFMQQFPAVNVRVEYLRANRVYTDVQQNTADIGLVAYPEKTHQIEITPFREDKLIVVCSPLNALSRSGPIVLTELSKQRLITFEPDIPTRRAIDSMFQAADAKATAAMEFDNIETVKRAVEIDAGVAIVPQATVRQELERKQLVQVRMRDFTAYRPLAIIRRKGRVITPALKLFIELLTDEDLVP